MSSELIERARSWIEGDPDPGTRAELTALIESDDMQELRSRMDGTLQFGTAGIRGKVEAGSNRMNRAVVIRTTKGLADYLLESHHGPPTSPVVIGFDARPSSRRFADDAAGVLAAAGIEVRHFPDVAPTPLVAFACKHLGAAAAVVVTASHNPPADNGYKAYAENGAQIVPPTDSRIASAIGRVGQARDVPRVEDPLGTESDLVSPVPTDLMDHYWEEVDASRPSPTPSSLKIVYTPLHGVGGKVVAELFGRAGHTGLMGVPEQSEPDGTFPTVAFPNPEEEGALDLAIELARAEDADLVIGNDPDADRLAVVIPVEGSWRPLTGNEIGVLLGDYILRNHHGSSRPIVVSTIVSSPMMGRLAEAHGARYERTLTGFKWIANAAMSLERQGLGEFVFGYEEALGFTVGHTVRDKDGMSAALVFADLVAGLQGKGVTVLDRLSELWDVAGVWASAQHSLVVDRQGGGDEISRAIETLVTDPPDEIAGHQVTERSDYRKGASARPPWLGSQDLIELTLGEEGRVLIRPSGTEPKLKIYADLTAPAGGDGHARHQELSQQAHRLAEEVAEMLPL